MGIPNLGTLKWNGMPITDGRFSGGAADVYRLRAVRRSPTRIGVVGHADGPDLATVFHGDKD